MGKRRGDTEVEKEPLPPPIRAEDVPRTRPELPDPRAVLHDAGHSSQEILARISNGDPLDLFPRCSARIRQRSFLIEVDRVFERALILVAVQALIDIEERGSLPWLLEKIDRAIEMLLWEDQEGERTATPAQDNRPWDFLVEAYQIEPAIARTAAVRFNNLEERTRRVFFRLLVDRAYVETCLAEGLGDRKTMREDAVRSLHALCYINDEQLEELLTRKKKK